jgi:hypothetical protein
MIYLFSGKKSMEVQQLGGFGKHTLFGRQENVEIVISFYYLATLLYQYNTVLPFTSS